MCSRFNTCIETSSFPFTYRKSEIKNAAGQTPGGVIHTIDNRFGTNQVIRKESPTGLLSDDRNAHSQNLLLSGRNHGKYAMIERIISCMELLVKMIGRSSQASVPFEFAVVGRTITAGPTTFDCQHRFDF